MKFYKILIYLIIVSLVISCSKKSNIENIEKQEHINLWADSLVQAFIDQNAKSEFDKFVLNQFIEDNKFSKDFNQIKIELESETFKIYKQKKARKFIIHVSKIGGKSVSEVEAILGNESSKEIVNPSNTPCPCSKYIYFKDLVEIVFIDDKADWITINNSFDYIRINDYSAYLSVQKYDEYTYIKVKTK